MGVVTGIEQDLVIVGSLMHEPVLPLFQDDLDIPHPLEIPAGLRRNIAFMCNT